MSKTIISDTSCLIAFDRINQLEILQHVFDSIVTTSTVQQEFGKDLPEWINVQDALNQDKKLALEKLVDTGEASAIALALEIQNSILIIDEKKKSSQEFKSSNHRHVKSTSVSKAKRCY